MGKSNVIQFPKEKSMRKLWQDRSQNQKASLALSVASVFIFTVFINEWMINSKAGSLATNGAGRGLASVEATNNAADIKWEHDMARQLASAELARPAMLAQKPSLRDELVFGQLQGKYGVKSSAGVVVEAEFLNQNAGDEPLRIADRSAFLKQYAPVLGKQVSQVSLKTSSGTEETYSLVDSKNNIVGSARFEFDSEGRVIHFKIVE